MVNEMEEKYWMRDMTASLLETHSAKMHLGFGSKAVDTGSYEGQNRQERLERRTRESNM